MTFANAEGEKVKYNAYKIVFKFPAEHVINDEYHAGEMQVWHTTDTRQTAVVSFFIDEEDDHDNAFFMDLSPPFWDVSGAYNVPRASLNLAAKGGIKQSLEKSFFFYRGSEATPPCKEGVEHFIVETPITCNQDQLEGLKERAVNLAVERSNARKARPFKDLILYYKD
jgi:carbonic anhydrase